MYTKPICLAVSASRLERGASTDVFRSVCKPLHPRIAIGEEEGIVIDQVLFGILVVFKPQTASLLPLEFCFSRGRRSMSVTVGF